MSATPELRLLARLYDLGVCLTLEGPELRYEAPADALTAEIKNEITRHKSAIVRLLRATVQDQTEAPSKTPPQATREFPASAEQHAMYTALALSGAGAYTEAFAIRLRSALSPANAQAAMNAVIARHELLRAGFVECDDELRVQIADEALAESTTIDLSACAGPDAEAEIVGIVAAARQRDFDLRVPPLLRTVFVQRAPSEFVAAFVVHHLVCDSWSGQLIVRDFLRHYHALQAGHPPAIDPPDASYREYAESQRAQQRAVHRSVAYWRDALEGCTPTLDFPPCLADDAPRDQCRATQRFVPGTAASARVNALARTSGTTLSNVVLAAFSAVLYRCFGQDDLVVGIPLSTRKSTRHEATVGPYLTTVALRIRLDGGQRFPAHLARVGTAMLGALQHSDAGIAHVVASLAAGRPADSVIPLTAGYVFHSAPGLDEPWRSYPIEVVDVETNNSKFEIELLVNTIGDTLEYILKHDRARLGQAAAQQMITGIQVLLDDAIDNPGKSIDELKVLDEDSTNRIVIEFNEPEHRGPAPARVEFDLGGRCEDRPGAVALRHQARCIRYAELARLVQVAAQRLTQSGVRRGDLTGICLRDPIDYSIMQYAVLRCGAAFVPLDFDAGDARRSAVVESSRLAFLIADAPTSNGSPAQTSAASLPFGSVGEFVVHAFDRPSEGLPGGLAYVMFTSGSTGTPKGVMISHRAVLNTLDDIAQRFGLGPDDRTLAVSKPTFDLAIFDVFGTLNAGGAVVFADRENRTDPKSWYRTLNEHGVTVWNSVPVLFEMLVEYIESRSLPWPDSLRLVLLSGDWIPLDLPARARALGCCAELVSLGGATEASIWSIVHPIDAVHPQWTSIPYGRPLRRQRLHILNKSLRPCPLGAAGDLYIGGDGLSDGYLWDAERSAESFLAHETLGGLYKTGDRARYWPDGNVEFLGRGAGFVKIRGYRVDPLEVSREILQHPAVAKCIVIADSASKAPALTAVVVPRPGRHVNPAELELFLRGGLPGPMIPSSWHVVDRIPLTTNGKLDVLALLRRGAKSERGSTISAALSPTESKLIQLSEQMLGVTGIGKADDFFAWGGNSLLATRLSARIYSDLGVDVPFKDILGLRTVDRIATRIDGLRWLAQQVSAPQTPRPRGLREFIL